MCWYCEKWEDASPKSFARWKAVAEGARNGRDIGLLRAARRTGEEIVTTTTAKTLKRMTKLMRKYGTTVVVEGLRASDGSRVTKEDYALFSWATGHAVVEWGDHSMQVERVQ